jgi:hypothetical protein
MTDHGELVASLRYIADSPDQEYGGFHPQTIQTAKEAISAIEQQGAEIALLYAAIKRSGLDTTMCSYCGEMMFVLPDGGNLCAKCAEENQ